MTGVDTELERARRKAAERQQRILSAVSRVLLDYVGADDVEPLRRTVHKANEARDGEAALVLARGARPDLMLVDLMMPVMDGATLIHRLREQQVAAGVPVVVFSADRDAREKARALSAAAALRKPFELQELQEVMDRLLPQIATG